MPALKNKTNLPNLDRRDSAEPSLPPQKKKRYSRKTELVAEKVATKGIVPKAAGSRVKGGAKKEVPAGIVKRGKQSGTAKHQLEVEVIIDRPIKATSQGREKQDELASDSDDSEHFDSKSKAQKVPSRSVNGTRQSMLEVEEDAGNEIEEPKFWQGGSQESIDDLIDNLLKNDTGNVAREKGDAEKKSTELAKALVGKANAKRSILPSNKKDKPSATGHHSDLPVAGMPPPRSATFPTDLAVPVAPDLAHAVVLKVVEHALRKNIDWFTMSKELEAEGFKNGKVATVRGKGKGKGSKGNDAHGEGSESTTVRQNAGVKMDGNSLYEMFHYTILPSLKSKRLPWNASNGNED